MMSVPHDRLPEVRDVLIVGDGIVGRLAAAMLALALGPAGVRVRILPVAGEDRSLGATGRVVHLRPGDGIVARDLARSGELRRRLRAVSTLGEAFSGWTADGATWMLPFGDVGAPIGSVAFQHLVHRMRADGHAVRPADFSLSALAAQSGRFAWPSDDPASPLAALDHGWTLDADALRDHLREQALGAGAVAAGDRFAVVVPDDAGGLAAVVTDRGERIEADFFLDATGPERLLFADRPVETWGQWFPFDRVGIGWTPEEHPPLPFAHVQADAVGWRSTLTVAGGRSDVFGYIGSATDDDDRIARTIGAVQMRCQPHAPGRLRNAVAGNRIALGAAAADLPPFFGNALPLAGAGIADLVSLFPARRAATATLRELDRLLTERADHARDMAVLIMHLCARPEAAWAAVRDASLPQGLRYRLDLYRSRGRVAMFDGDTFEEPEWVALLDAMGVRPRRRDALTDVIDRAALISHFRRLREVLDRTVRTMTPHAAFVGR